MEFVLARTAGLDFNHRGYRPTVTVAVGTVEHRVGEPRRFESGSITAI
jgi:hypothetical protein